MSVEKIPGPNTYLGRKLNEVIDSHNALYDRVLAGIDGEEGSYMSDGRILELRGAIENLDNSIKFITNELLGKGGMRVAQLKTVRYHVDRLTAIKGQLDTIYEEVA